MSVNGPISPKQCYYEMDYSFYLFYWLDSLEVRLDHNSTYYRSLSKNSDVKPHVSHCDSQNLQYKTHPEFWPSHRQIFKTSLYYKTHLIIETRRYSQKELGSEELISSQLHTVILIKGPFLPFHFKLSLLTFEILVNFFPFGISVLCLLHLLNPSSPPFLFCQTEAFVTIWVIIFNPKDFSHFTGVHIHNVLINLIDFSLCGPGDLDSFYDIQNLIPTVYV